jgi:flagellar biosynthesis protein FlhG
MEHDKQKLKARQSSKIQKRHGGVSSKRPNVYPLPSRAESEVQTAKATAKKLKIPFIDPLHARIEPAAISLLKSYMAFKFRAVPIRIVNDILLVAMANPSETLGIKTLEMFTRCKIRPAAAPRSSVSMALQEVYGLPERHAAKNGQGAFMTTEVKTPLESEERARIISIISNKGGVGKTHLSINIAYALAKAGAKVLLVDTDLGNADISIKLGIFPKHHLLDFLEKDQRMQDLIVHTKFDFDLICSMSGNFKLANMNYAQKIRFITHFKSVSQGYDFVVFDHSAGISRTVLDFALVADRTVIVTTPQDLISGYACAKASFFRFKELEERLERKLPGHTPQWNFTPMVVINQARSLAEGIMVYDKIDKASNKDINANEGRFRIEPEYLGAILYDRESLRKAEVKKRPLLFDSPNIKASQCIQHMSKRFFNPENPYDPMMKFRNPFGRLVAILSQKD